jgi:flavin-dependent dehydrogenase
MLVETAARAGASIFYENEIEECTEEDHGWCISAWREGVPRGLKCRLVVDARGRAPAGGFGFPRRIAFDRLIAVVGLSRPAPRGCASDYTLVEAVDEGWFYSAMVPCGEYVLAYLTDADIYTASRARSSSFLAEQLAKAPHTLARLERVPPAVAVFSAVTSVRDAVTRRNWLAVGDAARSYDPLSGLGLWSAMKMASESVQVIMDLLEGNVNRVFDYERAHLEAFAQYRSAHRAYYGLERRWPASEFWRRRRDST